MDENEELEEERAAAAEVADRLRRRGIVVGFADRAHDLVDLLSAVQRFEASVERHGGDLMVDDLKSSRPDDRHFVVPQRGPGEAIRDYIGRIEEATARLRRHPSRPD